MIIPTELFNKWRKNTADRERTQIEDLLELRELIQDAKDEGEQVVMQMYHEAAQAFRLTPKALQNKVLILREYPCNKLLHWVNVDGLALDTIRTVNEYASYDMLHNEAPADVIDRAIDQGNGFGTKPTAAEIETLILESHGIKSDEYKFNRYAYGFLKFGITRKDEFIAELKQLVERYRQ